MKTIGTKPTLVSSCKSLVFKIDSIFPADAIPFKHTDLTSSQGCAIFDWKLYNQTDGTEIFRTSGVGKCFDEKNGAIRFSPLLDSACPLADKVIGNKVPTLNNLNITFSCLGNGASTSVLVNISTAQTPIKAIDGSLVHYKDANLDLPNEPSSYFGIKEKYSNLKAVYLLNNRQIDNGELKNDYDGIVVGEVKDVFTVTGAGTLKTIERYISNELLQSGMNKGSAVLFGWLNSSDIRKLDFFTSYPSSSGPILEPALTVGDINKMGFESRSLLDSIEKLARNSAKCNYNDETCLAIKLPQARLRIFQEKATETLQKSLFRRGYVQTIYCANSTALTQEMVENDNICKDSFSDWIDITPNTKTIFATCNPCKDAAIGNAYYADTGSALNGQSITASSSKSCDSRCDCAAGDTEEDCTNPTYNGVTSVLNGTGQSADILADPANGYSYYDNNGKVVECTDSNGNVDPASNTCPVSISCSEVKLCRTQAIEDGFPLDCDQCGADGKVIGSEYEVADTPTITWLNNSIETDPNSEIKHPIQAIQIDRPDDASVLEKMSPYSYFFPDLNANPIKFSMVFTENNYAMQKNYAGFKDKFANTKSNAFPQKCDARQGIYVASLQASIFNNNVAWSVFQISNMSIKDVVSSSGKACAKVPACNLVGVSDIPSVYLSKVGYDANDKGCFNFDWPIVPKGIASGAAYVFDGTAVEAVGKNAGFPKCPKTKKHFTLLADQKSNLKDASICLRVSSTKNARYLPFNLDILSPPPRYFAPKPK